VRVQALNHYGVHGPDREQNFLFGPDNQTEIAGHASMGSQVQPGSQLYLRPRTAGGGGGDEAAEAGGARAMFEYLRSCGDGRRECVVIRPDPPRMST